MIITLCQNVFPFQTHCILLCFAQAFVNMWIIWQLANQLLYPYLLSAERWEDNYAAAKDLCMKEVSFVNCQKWVTIRGSYSTIKGNLCLSSWLSVYIGVHCVSWWDFLCVYFVCLFCDSNVKMLWWNCSNFNNRKNCPLMNRMQWTPTFALSFKSIYQKVS